MASVESDWFERLISEARPFIEQPPMSVEEARAAVVRAAEHHMTGSAPLGLESLADCNALKTALDDFERAVVAEMYAVSGNSVPGRDCECAECKARQGWAARLIACTEFQGCEVLTLERDGYYETVVSERGEEKRRLTYEALEAAKVGHAKAVEAEIKARQEG